MQLNPDQGCGRGLDLGPGLYLGLDLCPGRGLDLDLGPGLYLDLYLGPELYLGLYLDTGTDLFDLAPEGDVNAAGWEKV